MFAYDQNSKYSAWLSGVDRVIEFATLGEYGARSRGETGYNCRSTRQCKASAIGRRNGEVAVLELPCHRQLSSG